MKKLIYIFFAISVIFSACEKETTNGIISSNNTNGNSDASFSVMIGVDADTYSPAELDITWMITEDSTGLIIAEGTEASNLESYTLDSNSCYTVEMTSSGDGWGDYFLIVGNDEIGNIWYGQLEFGSNGTDNFCSYYPVDDASWDCDPSGCYDPGTGYGQYNSESACQNDCGSASGYEMNVIVTDGENPLEISWEIYDPSGSGTIIATGGAPFSAVICISSANLGSLEFRMYDDYGDGWEGATYTLIGTYNFFTDGTLEDSDYGVDDFIFNVGEPCNGVTDDILGCMDPSAINYNFEATIDDGSCEYEEEFCPQCGETSDYCPWFETGVCQYGCPYCEDPSCDYFLTGVCINNGK